MFADKKARWIEHFKENNNGADPRPADINNWICQLSPYDFLQMRNEAADYFHFAAEEHLRQWTADQIKQGVDSSILAAVKSFTSWWKHLAIALSMAILAPIILG